AEAHGVGDSRRPRGRPVAALRPMGRPHARPFRAQGHERRARPPLVRPVGRGPPSGARPVAGVHLLPAGAVAMTAAWNRFWFRPRSTSTLAVLRIAVGLVLVGWTLTVAPDVRTFFSHRGMLPAQPHVG